MSATKPAPVASVLARRAMATFPPDNLSPMIPEPITVARRNAVPRASAAALRARSTAAATASLCLHGGFGLGLRLVLDSRDAAAGGAHLRGGGLSLYDEDLPGVAVRILDPDLVLEGIAALGVLLRLGDQAGLLEACPRGRNVLAPRHLDAEVARVDARTR